MSQIKRIIRSVERDKWLLSEALGKDRVQQLSDVPSPKELIANVLSAADHEANSGGIRLQWKDCDDVPGEYSQIVAQIPLTEKVFDQLFNGRSGYRAQYYLSPEEGILFNRELLEGLVPVIHTAYSQKPLEASFEVIEKSLRAPHSKLWVFEEFEAFNQAKPEMLNPSRWVENNAMLGRRAPLPPHFTIEVKGSLINLTSDDIYINPAKLDRAWDLFRKGFT